MQAAYTCISVSRTSVSQAWAGFVCSWRYLTFDYNLDQKRKRTYHISHLRRYWYLFPLFIYGGFVSLFLFCSWCWVVLVFFWRFFFILRTVFWRNPMNNLFSFSVTAVVVILSGQEHRSVLLWEQQLYWGLQTSLQTTCQTNDCYK